MMADADPIEYPRGPFTQGWNRSANVRRILREEDTPSGVSYPGAITTSKALRDEAEAKGLKGFKKGGKVKATGKAKVHKGEYVLKKSAARRIGTRKLNRMNSDRGILERTPFNRGR
jgi:hypothetical protein